MPRPARVSRRELAELDITVAAPRTGRAACGTSPTPWSRSGTRISSRRRWLRARTTGGTAVLLRPTPVAAVAAVAAAGARMPRKSTLFTPKPASGLLMRRFVDEQPAAT